MTKFKDYGFDITTMTPPACLEEIASTSSSDLELLAETSPSTSYSAEDELAMLRSKVQQLETSEGQLRILNQFFADAGRSTSVAELELRYEGAFSTIFGIEDANVRVFTSQEDFNAYELEHDPSQVFTQDIYGQTHDELYNMVVINFKSRKSAKKLNSARNQNYGVFLENIMTNTQNKLKSWIDKKSGLFTETYLDEADIDKRKTSTQATSDGYGAIYFDIDQFKQCNDTYGHSIGDEVIGYFGNIIKKNIRTDDIAIRAGGSADEFVMFTYGCTPQDLVDMAKRISNSLGEYKIPGHEDVKITASAGIAHSYEATGLDELKDLSEKRMRHDKKSRGASVPPYMTEGYLQHHQEVA